MFYARTNVTKQLTACLLSKTRYLFIAIQNTIFGLLPYEYLHPSVPP